MTVVVDANILIAFGLADEPLHTEANQMLSAWRTAGEHLIAPLLFRSEITAVVRKVVYQQRATPEQGRSMLAKLLGPYARSSFFAQKPHPPTPSP